MYRHILVPLDHSATDEVVIRHIRDLAKFTGARLTLIHVADGHVARNFEHLNLTPSPEMVADRAYLKKREAELSGDDLMVESHLAFGEPAKEILLYAEKIGCDLIAMSTHGHRLIGDLILGSVADAIRHRTDLPVLLIRAPRKV